MNLDIERGSLEGDGVRIGIVQARFNDTVCDGLRQACVSELLRLGVLAEDIFLCSVPGALEMGIALQRLARTGEFDSLIALGAVIRGDTYHFKVVSNESAAAIQRVSLDESIPIANGILTCDTDAQAEVRIIGKGADCARVAIEMAHVCATLTLLGISPDELDADVDADADADSGGAAKAVSNP
jgi:6,7-dimethyl-8-ribityllumazine synthase